MLNWQPIANLPAGNFVLLAWKPITKAMVVWDYCVGRWSSVNHRLEDRCGDHIGCAPLFWCELPNPPQEWAMTPDSSNVQGFRMDGKDLLIQFKGGGVYRYPGVSDEDFKGLALAESVGKYINETIKPNYPCKKEP